MCVTIRVDPVRGDAPLWRCSGVGSCAALDDDVSFAGVTHDLERPDEGEAETFAIPVVDEDEVAGADLEDVLVRPTLQHLEVPFAVLKLLLRKTSTGQPVDFLAREVGCLHVFVAVKERVGEVFKLKFTIEVEQFRLKVCGEGSRVHRSVVVHPSGVRRGDDVDLRAKVCR